MSESLLELYTTNLNERAKNNLIDPLWGRKKELKQLTSIMLKRTKSNPIILGAPGVGKTAIVEELARSIVNKTCHHDLLDIEVLSLDIAGLVAGSKERGEMEDRLTGILEELLENPNYVIMIDEIHMLGSTYGGASNSGKSENANTIISNILKPSLARGLITCIGATTMDEYVQSFCKDKALERRFQPIVVEEPSKEDTLHILKYIKKSYEEFHNCEILDEALEQCIHLSEKYLFYRNFPDKAIDLLDEACSKVKIDKFHNTRDNNIVNREDVNKFMQQIIDVPLKLETDIQRMNILEKSLKKSFFGQEEAVKVVIDTMKRHICGFYNPNRPIASMMFIGPPGTGKTHLVNVLAEGFFESKEKSIIRLDMSEYMDENSVSSLIGTPPGYIGYEDSGILIKQIKNNPYSVVLFDEIEKAHPKIYNTLLQIIDDGILSDNTGKTYSFKNSILIFTSNIGFTGNSPESLGFQPITQHEKPYCTYNRQNIIQELKYTFKPEFLNRIDCIVPFEYLSSEIIREIANKMISDTLSMIHIKLGCQPVISNTTRERIIEIGTTKHLGARPLRNAINTYIVDPVSEKVLENIDMKNRWFVI